MFDFKPSAELVQKIFDNLKTDLNRHSIAIPVGLGNNIELARTRWGRYFVETIGMCAQRCRHGWNEPNTPGVAKESFCILQNGTFTVGVAEDVCGSIPILEGEAGDKLLQELSAELLAWIKKHPGSAGLHPRAPVIRFEVQGENVLAYVRPYVPPPKDPNWVPATVVE